MIPQPDLNRYTCKWHKALETSTDTTQITKHKDHLSAEHAL